MRASIAKTTLFALVRGAWPYRALSRAEFDAVARDVRGGLRDATRPARGAPAPRRGQRDAARQARRRLLAQTSGGAIPEIADYRVILDPDDTFIGTLNEDFAIESNAGDVFQLGNASWRILQVHGGTVRVADAQGGAADDSVLAGRGAGAQRRAVARRERSASSDR